MYTNAFRKPIWEVDFVKEKYTLKNKLKNVIIQYRKKELHNFKKTLKNAWK